MTESGPQQSDSGRDHRDTETNEAEVGESDEPFWANSSTDELEFDAGAASEATGGESESGEDDPLDRRIDSWKEQLLDLTRRNKLIDFAETKTKSLPLHDPDPLAIAETILSGEPLYVRKSVHGDGDDEPPDSADVEPNELATTRSEEETRASLQNLRLNQQRARQETGVDALFLSFGTLRWYEIEHSEEALRSPLLLLSVELDRETSRRAERHDYELTVSDVELRVNPALRKKLSAERGLTLPPDEAFSLDALGPSLKAIQEAIEGFERWTIAEEVLLGIFDFTKFGLYADLEENREAVKGDPLIRAINDEPSALDDPPETPAAAELDEAVAPADTFQVLDADSSQQAAIEAAKRGADFVLQGPPGTGKSQTIANIIAEKLAQGEKVLFVSEKQAALEVVQNRLSEVGLGRFCLEAHGEKANKQDILDGLAAELRADPIRYPDDRDGVAAELESVRRELNQYGDLLFYTPPGQDITAYGAMGRVANNADAPAVEVGIEAPLEREPERIEGMVNALETLAGYEDVIENFAEHPWRHTTLDDWRVDTGETARDVLSTGIEALDSVEAAAERIESALGISVGTVAEFEQAATLVDLLANRPDAPLEERFFEQAFHARADRMESFIEIERGIENHRAELEEKYSRSVFSEDGREIHAELATYGLLKPLRPSYRSLRSRLLEHTVGSYEPTYEELLEDARRLMELQLLEEDAEDHDGLRSQLGFLYDGTNTDWDRVEELFEWVSTLGALDRLDTERIERELIAEEFESLDSELVADVSNAQSRLDAARDELARVLDLDALEVEGTPITETSVGVLRRALAERRERIEELQQWLQFTSRLAEVRAEYDLLDRYLGAFLAAGHGADSLVPAFERAFFTAWLNDAYARTELGSFNATEIEELREEFRRLDRQQQEYAAAAIQHEVTRHHPRMELEHAESSEQVFLRREINKSRRHKPLRTLFREAPSLISTLKPCFMMSPLSVAQYIEYGAIEFDVVIFDEASQIMPQDAVSSLIRAEQTIIAGDAKQLPPTAFFDADVESADAVREDLESILDEAASVLPEKRLLWHYRSNTNELIEFSNQKYYDGRLKTFPDNNRDSERRGVELEYVEDGCYERGGSGRNEPEAERVVDLVEAHIEERSDESLGVVAFSRAQANAVRDEIERRRDASPALAAFVNTDDTLEGFFVKSLENVQGDERDRLLFTLGYGPDPEGRISMNFGPLNQSGGERRLNVAVTRARNQITVVSSIRHSDIDLARTNSRGVRDFKHYLEYAETGPAALRRETTTRSADQFDSAFEEAVCTALRERGHDVDTQVQSAGYSIDLGVRHPERPGEYVLGVECDGAAYHASKTARDRDRTRQAVLEELGWDIHRIWSPDWTANRAGQLDAIERRIESAIASGGEVSVTDGGVRADEPNPAVEPVEAEPMAPAERGGYGTDIVAYEAPVDIERQEGAFDEAPRERIAAALLTVVAESGPLGRDVAFRQTAAAWGVSRLGSNVEDRLCEVVAVLERTGRLVRADGFLWATPTESVPVRRNTEQASRSIDEIPPAEIGKAAYVLLDAGGAMSRSDLVLETARLFGYERTGRRIERRIGAAIRRLLGCEAIEADGDELRARDVNIDDRIRPTK